MDQPFNPKKTVVGKGKQWVGAKRMGLSPILFRLRA